MVNTRIKMQRTNSIVRTWMVQNGFKDIAFFPHTRFSKDLHFAGLEFDGIASVDNTLVLFQCKTNRRATKELLNNYERVSETFNIKCIYFNYINRKGLEVNNQCVK
jgi:hypothetical protein